MEVPAPESGDATATGKRGTGVGRAPESSGGGRVRGRRAAGTPSRAARRVGGSRAGGRGGGGVRRALGGRGRARPLSRARPRALPVLARWPRSLPSVAGLLLSRRPPGEVNPEASRRGAAAPQKPPFHGARRAPSAEGPVVGAGSRGGRHCRGAHGRAPGAVGVPGPRSARRAGQKRP